MEVENVYHRATISKLYMTGLHATIKKKKKEKKVVHAGSIV